VRRPLPALSATLALVAVLLASGCGGGEVVEAQGDPEAGRELVDPDNQFVAPNCGLCHVLKSAGFEGTSAPDLDSMQPGYERTLRALEDGPGAMPSFSDQLDEGELRDVAAYIAGAAGEDAEAAEEGEE
jgi:cytochrome c6